MGRRSGFRVIEDPKIWTTCVVRLIGDLMSVTSKSIRKIGRSVRGFDLGILRMIEGLLVRGYREEEIDMPLLAVCGPPRSGHTLTHQVITQGLNVFTLDNLQGIFYRTPLIGYLLSRVICKPYVSDYHSKGGYIKGWNGPHEGTFMWEYWCDMSGEEHLPMPDLARVQKFKRLVNKLYNLDGRPFCDQTLSLAVYFDQLQTIFPRNLIIRVRRDLLSNAVSIVKHTGHRQDSYLMSLRPRECQDSSLLLQLSFYERVARQVYFINRRMDDQAATGRYWVFNSFYPDLCKDPSDFILRLVDFAKAKDIILEQRKSIVLPERFSATKVYRNQNEQTKALALAFDALVEKYGPVSVPLESV